MKEVTAYLNFDGNCRQAMTFYNSCLGAEIQLSTFPDAQGKPSEDPNGRIMHARLINGGQAILMASDGQPGSPVQPGNNFSIAIQCDSIPEIERLFPALSQNGKVTMPLQDTFWGARFGMFTDQFGIHWMLNCDLPK